jgi:predicted DNA-binding helix-hairpin-helix protein
VANRNELTLYRHSPTFVPGGQSTQIIIGATPENDFQLLTVAENLYDKFSLKRVFYSAFVNVNEDSLLPALPTGPPLKREHRLYQADWLLRFYGFQASELLNEDRPYFNVMLDPKEDWAIRHLEFYPIEINQATKEDLLRVPGIGVRSANRILTARKSTKLSFHDLKKLGIVLKRALFFITCNGHMMYPTKLEEDYLVRNLTSDRERVQFGTDAMTYRQMSLFDTEQFNPPILQEDRLQAAVGEL